MHSQDDDTMEEDDAEDLLVGSNRSVLMFSSQSDSSQSQPSITCQQRYAELLRTIENQLQEGNSDKFNEDDIFEDFQRALNNISLLINQSFVTVSVLLQKQEPGGISPYLKNSALVLTLLGRYLSGAEVVRASCGMLSPVLTVTAAVLKQVFAHCKTSSSLYGAMVCQVEGELKELFRACRELQVVYLDILQNKMFFQTEYEIDVLVQALRINIEIGEIVIALDVKTMADQWKCFSAICERYSEQLASEDVAEVCVDTLARVVLENIQSCVEENQEEKALLRTLKVTSFLMKIVIKMCQVFRQQVLTDYAVMVKLLVTIKTMEAGLGAECAGRRRELVRSHVTVAADPLLAQLLDNADFAGTLLSSEPQLDCDAAGHILVLASVMAALLRRDQEATLALWLQDAGNIVCVALSWLPACTSDWLNEGFKLEMTENKGEQPSTCGLLEYLVPLASAVSVRSSPEQFLEIEEAVVSTLVTTDCEWTALFVSDLWVVIARFAPEELCVEQITCLANTLKHLHKCEGTSVSPGAVRLRGVTRRLYCTLSAAERSALYRAFALDDADNNPLWAAVGVCNLPEKESRLISDEVFSRLKMNLQRFLNGDIRSGSEFYKLIETIDIASASIPSQSVPTEEILRCCAKCYGNPELRAVLPSDEDAAPGARWCCHLLAALLRLTVVLLQNKMLNNKQLVQVLDVLSSIAEKSSITLKLSSLSLLRELAGYDIAADCHAAPLCDHIALLFRVLLQDCDLLVKAKTFEAFKHFSIHTNTEQIIIKVVNSNRNLRDSLIEYMKNGSLTDFHELKLDSCVKFKHKCPTYKTDCVVKVEETKESSSSNFQFADIDMIFNDCEFDKSASAKVGMSNDEVNGVVNRLESDSLMLQTMHLSVEHKNRIKSLVLRLQNIIK